MFNFFLNAKVSLSLIIIRPNLRQVFRIMPDIAII
jgi:hypothetical protein